MKYFYYYAKHWKAVKYLGWGFLQNCFVVSGDVLVLAQILLNFLDLD